MRVLSCLILLSAGCTGVSECQNYASYYYNVSDYDINPCVVVDGVEVDATRDTDLERLADIVTKTEQCLVGIGILPEKEALAAWCPYGGYSSAKIRRECITIKVVEDYAIACNGEDQVLHDRAPIEACTSKGVEPSPECPCRWRVAIQDGNTVITPPNMKLLSDALTRIATGCAYVWGSPRLAECAMISAGIVNSGTVESCQ